MKGVSMIRVTFLPHAYCTGLNGETKCPWECWSVGAIGSAAVLRNDAQRHVQDTGHTVLVDIIDRTSYEPENEAAEVRS